MRGNTIDDVNELMIDRGGVTDDADAMAIKTGRREQSLRAQRDTHEEIITQATQSDVGDALQGVPTTERPEGRSLPC